jgi:alcohol dehydrogenase
VTVAAQDLATALVLEAPRRLVRRQVPIPDVGEDDAILRVEACGLCGTDHELFTGALPWPPGFIPGHETVGVIESIGPTACSRWGVRAGDRVAVASRPACRECPSCLTGDLHSCERFSSTDSLGLITTDRAPALWGGYATHHYLRPEAVLHPVPDGLGALEATLFNPVGAGIEWAVDLPGTGPGDVVAILGPGIRGLAAVAAAKAAGAAFVMVTGFGPRDAVRLELASRLGADLVLDTATADPVEAMVDAAGRLADVVVDVTAKAPLAFAQALALAGRGGRVVIAGVRGGAVTLTFEPDFITNRGLRVIGASGVSTAAQRRALELVASGAFPWTVIPRRSAGFSDVDELLATMAGERGDEMPVHAVFVPDAAG